MALPSCTQSVEDQPHTILFCMTGSHMSSENDSGGVYRGSSMGEVEANLLSQGNPGEKSANYG